VTSITKKLVGNGFKAYFESVLANMQYAQIFRISLIASLLAEALILFFTGIGIYKIYDNHMFRNAEKVAVSIRGAVIKQERKALTDLNVHGNAGMQINDNDLQNFDRRIRSFLSPFQIAKIKIFDLNKKIIYSTDSSLVGKTIIGNERLNRALGGSIVSRLETGKHLIDLEGEEQLNLDVIETYVPVIDESGVLIGCFELYFDVTPYRQESQRILFLSLGIIFIVLVVVFGVLNFFICRMIKTICSNTLELKATHEKIEKIVLFDQLTELPNRNLITDRFEQMTAQASRHDKKVAVFFMDLDNFKNLNDTELW
jgi:hypothetical protein